MEGAEAVVRLDAGPRCLARPGEGSPGDRVDVAVRPEAISLDRDDPAAVPDEGPYLRGSIQQSAYLGTSVSHIVGIDAGVPLQVVVPRGHERYATGDAVQVRWRAADAMVLPRPAAGSAVEEQP